MRILCFDIGGTFIKYGLCDENFNLLEKDKIPTLAENGGQSIIERVIDIIEQYDSIDRVAVSTAGQVDSENGIVVYSTDNIPYYTGMRVKSLIENKTGIPTFVENDVNSAALGEAHFGAAKGVSDFICLTLGTGIGGAIFLNNKLYKGSASSAGELGHMIIHSGGKQCTCGGEGCYECYASASALIKAVNKVSPVELNAFQIFEKENIEKPEIRSEIDKWIDEIIVGLVNIIYIFNPSMIVLGGGIMNEDYIIELIDRKIYTRLMDNFKNVKIVRPKLGNDAGMIGAAYEASKL
ncbi:ROK family protein [uncultured Eubacterium sp.]|uniref:ROK family protein n=1 Tax=uncultured Eubacterium sp. TaxID=165185 RepID=UPI0025D53F15|nr:ROK family protein [uncultured Eubacterium sp.]